MNDSGSHPREDEQRWLRLTEKQRACLDLLLEHKTSKEIARRLDISKHTVDQRLAAARDTLGTADRNDTAVVYRQLKSLYDRMTYDAVQVPPPPALMRSDFQSGSPPNLMDLRDSNVLSGRKARTGSPFRDLWRRDFSPASRIAIMLALLAVTILILLGGLAISQTLSQLLSS